MGLLDKKTRVVDICLTERGRELLAQNRLSIDHYAFSDELVDYSGSLRQALQQSASLDDVVYRNYVAVEASSMGGATKGTYRDLRSFLYTCAEQRASLPPFTTNVSGNLSLQRTYQQYDFIQVVNALSDVTAEFNVVMYTTEDNPSDSDREVQYLAEQDFAKVEQAEPELITLVKL